MRSLALVLLLPGCALLNGPALDTVLARVDVPRLVQCGQHLPDYQAAARCLGAEVLTQGLKVAMDKALELAERARESGGAETSEDTERLAQELDGALDVLASEVVAANRAAL